MKSFIGKLVVGAIVVAGLLLQVTVRALPIAIAILIVLWVIN